MQCCARSSRQFCIRKNPVHVILILLCQHFTDQNSMQYCLRDTRQHCIIKNPVQSCLNTPGRTLHRTKPYAMLSKRLQTTLCKKKSCVILFFSTLGATLHGSKLHVMLSERLLTTLHEKKSCSMMS